MSTARRRLRTLEALALLCLGAVAIRLLPVRWLLPRDGAATRERTTSETALAVRAAIRSAVMRLPVKPACLVQSVAAAAMLRRRRLAYRFHIGARMKDTFEAHAWVESGGVVVAGDGELQSFSVLLTRQH